MPTTSPLFKNPHLNGDPFFWEAGSTGLLLIHGFTATTAEVRPLAKAFYDRGYTVSGPVLPGHNTFPEDINNFTWQDWASEVERVYLELTDRCDQVFVGGESTGGLLALHLGHLYPEIFGLLTYAPALKLMISPLDQIKLRLAAPFIPYLSKGDLDDDLPWKGYTVNPLKGILQLLKLQKYISPLLPQIQQPTLIVQGKLDTTVDASVPQTIYNNISSKIKEYHWMDKSSHCVILDSELDQVIDITFTFLNKCLLDT